GAVWVVVCYFFFFSSRRRHTRSYGDWSSDVCSSDLPPTSASPFRLRPARIVAIRAGRSLKGEALVGGGLDPARVGRGYARVDLEIGRASCRERGGGAGRAGVV